MLWIQIQQEDGIRNARCMILDAVDRKVLSEKGTFEQEIKGSERKNPLSTPGKRIPGDSNSNCEGSKVGT